MEFVAYCTKEEVLALINYLRGTPVGWWLVDVLERQPGRLIKARICSIKELGLLKTEFGELEGVFAKDAFGQDRFLVNHVLDVLQSPECKDISSLESVLFFMEQERQGKLRPIITVTRHNREMVIRDGNKRCVAFYNVHKDDASSKAIDFPTYLIELDQGWVHRDVS